MTWWPAGGWVWSAPRNLVTNQPFYFQLCYATVKNCCTPRCHIKRNLMSFHPPHYHYDHFVLNLDSIDQAAMTAPCANEITLIPLEWLDSRSLVLPPQWLNLWEDAVLPPHEPIRYEDSRHEHLSCHHWHSNGEDARPTTAWTQSWGGPFVEYEGDHIGLSLFGWIVCSVDVKPFQCCQTNLIPILFQDCCIVDNVESKIYTNTDLIQKLCMTKNDKIMSKIFFWI